MLLAQASHGNLQEYIDANNPSIDLPLRKKWCRQSTEAIAYIHDFGVIHSDLRPDNFLVHEATPGTLSLLLCDFGGASCSALQLDGNRLPDEPFYDPTQGTTSTPALDIFSLGSVFYTILTGNWPYKTSSGPFESINDMLNYEEEVNRLFRIEKYPDVTELVGGKIILGCWTKKYKTAEKVLGALDEVMSISCGGATYS